MSVQPDSKGYDELNTSSSKTVIYLHETAKVLLNPQMHTVRTIVLQSPSLHCPYVDIQHITSNNNHTEDIIMHVAL